MPRLDSILKLIYRCTKAEAQGKRWPPVSGQNLYNLRYECLEFTIKTCGHCTIVPYIVPKIWNLEPCSPCLFFDPQWDTLQVSDDGIDVLVQVLILVILVVCCHFFVTCLYKRHKTKAQRTFLEHFHHT